jgi:hypothetical protein
MTGPYPNSPVLPSLADHLYRVGAARDKASRGAAFEALARAAEEAGAAPSLLVRLLERDANGHRFALEIAARLTPPLPGELIPELVALVEQSRFPTRLRVAVAAAIIRSLGTRSQLVDRIIDAFQRPVSPVRAANRLRRLAALVPDCPPVIRALSELDTGSAAPCPRCGARVGPEDLAKHLWERHRLLLENGRVREPWDVIGQWLTEFTRTSRAEFLDRSCDLAQALDPTGGLTRVHQLLLAGGSNDEEAHALLRAEATEKNATLCPHCFALVPQPTRAIPTPVLVGSGRVDGGRFRVEITDRYVISRLVIDTPEATVFSGPEPGHALTRRGAVWFFLLPLTIVAAIVAVMPPIVGLAPLTPTVGVLFAAVMAYLGIRWNWSEQEDPTQRAVDHAWTLLVPRMLQYQVKKADAAFLAGLAEASRGQGNPEAREEQLRRVADALRGDRVGIPYMTPVSVLQIEDAVHAGADELIRIANEVGECFDGQLPFDHAEWLVRELRGDPANRTRRARLRVLILARAFAAGLEPEDLRLIGQLCPALGAAYASEDRDGLARLRLLWLYRPRRLWQRIGSATTVFDLARYPTLAENYLRLRPDLLLFQASGGSDEAAPILICEEGVVYRDTVITNLASAVRVKVKSLVRGGGYELTIGDQAFRFEEDPTLLARRLKGWGEFLFEEFLPRARMLIRRRSPQGERLLLQKATTCTECRKTFLGLTGEIGLTALTAAVE